MTEVLSSHYVNKIGLTEQFAMAFGGDESRKKQPSLSRPWPCALLFDQPQQGMRKRRASLERKFSDGTPGQALAPTGFREIWGKP